MRWLIRGKLPEAGLGMIYGASGSYKSFFALDMALTLSQHKSVVYVVAEGETGMKKRVLAWRRHNKIAGGNIRFVETKGREDTGVANKDRAAAVWAESATQLTGQKWEYIKILQTKLNDLQPTEFSDCAYMGRIQPELF